MNKKKRFFTKKRIIRTILLILVLFVIVPSLILMGRVYSDHALREYVKDKFLVELKEDVSTYFSTSDSEKENLRSVEINIGDEEYAELQKQIDKRLDNLSQEGFQVMGSNEWEYVKAEILSGDKKQEIKLKIRGDMPSNYNRGIEEATLRLNVEDGAFLGKSKLSIIKPELESGYYGYLFYKTFKDENFLANHIELVHFYINGKYVGLRFIQEGFSKEILESSEKREGPILRFADDCTDCHGRYNEHKFPEMKAHQEKKTIRTENLANNYNRALTKYNMVRNGELAPEKLFNVELYAKFFALCDIFLAHHSYKCQNIKMYYNPIDDRLEPIAWDPDTYNRFNMDLPGIDVGHTQRFGEICNNQRQYPIHHLLKDNPTFLSKYAEYLRKYSNDQTIETMIKKYGDLINNTEVEMFRQNFQRRFNTDYFYYNLQNIRNDFNQEDLLYAAYYRDEQSMKVQSMSNIPIKIDSIRYGKTTKTVGKIIAPNSLVDLHIELKTKELNKKKIRIYSHTLYSGKSSTYKCKVFSNTEDIGGTFFNEQFERSHFEFDYDNKTFSLKNKDVQFNENLFIPDLGMTWVIEPGTKIKLANAFIMCESPIQSKGTKDEPVQVVSNHTGGIMVKNADQRSVLTYTEFGNLTAPHEGNWSTTGAVTFYRSNVTIDHCKFLNNMSEDALNIVNSEFEFKNSEIHGAASDALDVDFGIGTISNVSVINPKNDGLDFSGSDIEILSAHIEGAGDKGLSAGERTKLRAKAVVVKNSFIGVAAKDSSAIQMSASTISGCDYNFTIYQKKAEYDKAKIMVSASNISKGRYLLETGCELIVDEKKRKANAEDVYGLLYGDEE